MRPMDLPALPGRVSSMLPPLNLRGVFFGGMAFVLFVVILVLSGEFFEQLDAEEISNTLISAFSSACCCRASPDGFNETGIDDGLVFADEWHPQAERRANN